MGTPYAISCEIPQNEWGLVYNSSTHFSTSSDAVRWSILVVEHRAQQFFFLVFSPAQVAGRLSNCVFESRFLRKQARHMASALSALLWEELIVFPAVIPRKQPITREDAYCTVYALCTSTAPHAVHSRFAFCAARLGDTAKSGIL